jgi:peptidoglycan DL-endopeptidase CwlO
LPIGAKVGAAAGAAGFLYAAVFVLLLLPLIVAGAGAGSARSSVCGPGGTGQSVGGVQLDAEQMGNAVTVVSVTAGRRLPAYAATVALATVAAESMFHNYLVFKDADSLGLFQQRVQYYGAAVAASPARATGAFLDRLVAVHGWATRPLTEVAASVQMPRADLRGAYARWQPLAAALTARLWPGASAQTPALQTPTGSRAMFAAPKDLCGVAGAGPGGGSAAVPAGLALDGSAAGDRAARFALAQLGKPYLWGSGGPDSWDCSSLTQAGWASAGVAIARTTFEQVNAGAPVAMAGARSGDLVFIAGSDGTATNPGHVGMVAGRVGAAIYLVSAPHAGAVVQMTSAAQWASLVVSVRRIG